jgi:hypothetical protein
MVAGWYNQTWKKFLAFWASELGNQNPSAGLLRNISHEVGIIKKEFLLPAAEILL